MSGTLAGGKQAAITNKLRHGEDFYKIQGAKGGKIGKVGGFNNKQLASMAGRKGGLISRKGYTLTDEERQKIIDKLENKSKWFRRKNAYLHN